MGTERAFLRATDVLPPEQRAAARDRLKIVADRSRPTTLARDQVLPLLDPLTALFPDGLRRGSTLMVRGAGALMFGFAMVAEASTAGSWVVLVGVDDANLMVAHELGVALERVVVVQPPADQWAAAVAAVIGAFDIVLAGPPRRLSNADARRLMSRARERGSVLMTLVHTRAWPERVDAQVSLSTLQWDGLDRGHGHLLSRVIRADLSGRREFSRPRHCELVLPDARGGLARHHREIDANDLASAANE